MCVLACLCGKRSNIWSVKQLLKLWQRQKMSLWGNQFHFSLHTLGHDIRWQGFPDHFINIVFYELWTRWARGAQSLIFSFSLRSFPTFCVTQGRIAITVSPWQHWLNYRYGEGLVPTWWSRAQFFSNCSFVCNLWTYLLIQLSTLWQRMLFCRELSNNLRMLLLSLS